MPVREWTSPRRQLSRRARRGLLLAGVRPPFITGTVLFVVLAVGCTMFLGHSRDVVVSRAVLDGQEELAEDTARAVRASMAENAKDLDHAAAALSSTPDSDPVIALAAFGKAHRKWRGLALLHATTGRLVAVRGESVPIETLRGQRFDTSSAILVKPNAGQPRLLTIAPVTPPGRGPHLLVASSVPRLLLGASRSHSGTASYLFDDHGRQVNRLGRVTDARLLRPLITEAWQHAQRDGSGTLIGPRVKARRWIVGYAPVYEYQSPVSLNVVTVRTVADGTAELGDRGFGPMFGLALAGLVVFTFGLLYVASVRPLRRLAREARRLAGGELMRPVRISRVREARDLGYVLEDLRCSLRSGGDPYGAGPPRVRATLSLRWVLVFGVVLLIGWSVALPAVVFARTPRPVPRDAVVVQRERVSGAADAIRRTLNEGAFDLASIAELVSERRDEQAMRLLLDQVLERHSRFRSVYVLDGAGAVTARVGGAPRRPSGGAPKQLSVVQANTRGTFPVVVAYAPFPSGRGVLVGEYDPAYLAERLKREGVSRLWLVAPDRRVVAATRGFRAFSELPAADLKGAASRALSSGTTVRLGNVDRTPAIVSAAPVARDGPAAMLRWAVVAEHPINHLAMASYDMRRHALLVGMLGAVAALSVFGWEYLVVLQPLQRSVASARALVASDRATVRYPERPDEIGDIMRGLERMRLALVSPRWTTPASARLVSALTETQVPPVVLPAQREVRAAHLQLSSPRKG